MNYRHAFHAGNFADCVKHALLVWLLDALHRKPAPIAALDTHAGAGAYDLTDGPAQRTGEWRTGIDRLLHDPPAPLARYVDLVRATGLYPGSPVLIRALLRPDDRLTTCELHPDDAHDLRRRFAHDPQVAVHQRDAWEALGALLPPHQRRGLVLIDPPFEDPHEFAHLAAGIAAGHARFRAGVFAAWYPIKHRAPVRAFHAAILQTGIRDVVAAELCLREPLDPARLNGCGVLVVNPPYGFDAAAPPILDALMQRLGKGEPGAAATVTRLADE
ncbi:MAG TPA: 23S rRNA (adenine(2030)-N(6))-methyltransferase RlmJ [Acetobacteraceae bacterium]|jgi:23S rRNA (adenine2030-N6)-methyltransferase